MGGVACALGMAQDCGGLTMRDLSDIVTIVSIPRKGGNEMIEYTYQVQLPSGENYGPVSGADLITWFLGRTFSPLAVGMVQDESEISDRTWISLAGALEAETGIILERFALPTVTA